MKNFRMSYVLSIALLISSVSSYAAEPSLFDKAKKNADAAWQVVKKHAIAAKDQAVALPGKVKGFYEPITLDAAQLTKAETDYKAWTQAMAAVKPNDAMGKCEYASAWMQPYKAKVAEQLLPVYMFFKKHPYVNTASKVGVTAAAVTAAGYMLKKAYDKVSALLAKNKAEAKKEEKKAAKPAETKKAEVKATAKGLEGLKTEATNLLAKKQSGLTKAWVAMQSQPEVARLNVDATVAIREITEAYDAAIEAKKINEASAAVMLLVQVVNAVSTK